MFFLFIDLTLDITVVGWSPVWAFLAPANWACLSLGQFNPGLGLGVAVEGILIGIDLWDCTPLSG